MVVINLNSTADDQIAPELSEEALALEFYRTHANKLRYVAAWNRWLIYDGKCWRFDNTRQVFSLARRLCRETALAVNKPAERKRIASAKTRAAVVSLASDDTRLAASIDQWDADPWLLNTPGGVVDLRTGSLREHRSDDYMTKITAVAPGGDCPMWKNFIAKVTDNNDALGSYLARVCGYTLTGKIGEHALWFFWGNGRNGKSQFLNTISAIVGDYHCSAPIEAFTESQTDRHPTELAMLKGSRMVTSAETQKGRRWNETRINFVYVAPWAISHQTRGSLILNDAPP